MERNERGITLIALIITVIVLLILAGTAISIAINGGDIFEKTSDAREEWNVAVEKENSSVMELMNILNPYPNAFSVSQLYDSASTYFGLDVINYSEYLPEELQGLEWKLLYAGPIEGQTESHIYLITKDCIPYSMIPGKDGHYPVEINHTSGCAMRFCTGDSNGVMPAYNGISDITQERIKNLNKKYFDYLEENNKTCTSYKMRALAYLFDTEIWGKFANKFADFVIGEPTVEIIISAYNKYYNKTGEDKLVANVENEYGYDFRGQIGDAIFGVENGRSMAGYYTASPSSSMDQILNIIGVAPSIAISSNTYYNSAGWGIMPMVVLKNTCKLEPEIVNNQTVLRIVESTF